MQPTIQSLRAHVGELAASLTDTSRSRSISLLDVMEENHATTAALEEQLKARRKVARKAVGSLNVQAGQRVLPILAELGVRTEYALYESEHCLLALQRSGLTSSLRTTRTTLWEAELR
jgi:hypothetical protein